MIVTQTKSKLEEYENKTNTFFYLCLVYLFTYVFLPYVYMMKNKQTTAGFKLAICNLHLQSVVTVWELVFAFFLKIANC